MEFFLTAHQNGLAYFGGVPAEVWVDNCKTAVLDHPVGGPVTFHPRYVDLAQHYGFQIKAWWRRSLPQGPPIEQFLKFRHEMNLAAALQNVHALLGRDHGVAIPKVFSHARKRLVRFESGRGNAESRPLSGPAKVAEVFLSGSVARPLETVL